MISANDEFEAFVASVRPRLLRGLAGVLGLERAEEGAAEALAFAWEHWDRVIAMDNPAGYLFRVAQPDSSPAPRRAATPSLSRDP